MLYTIPSLFSGYYQDKLDDAYVDCVSAIQSYTPKKLKVGYIPATDVDAYELGTVLMKPVIVDEIDLGTNPVYYTKDDYKDLHPDLSEADFDSSWDKYELSMNRQRCHPRDATYLKYDTLSSAFSQGEPESDKYDRVYLYSDLTSDLVNKHTELGKYVDTEVIYSTEKSWFEQEKPAGVVIKPTLVSYSHVLHQELTLPKLASFPPSNEIFCQRLDQATNALDMFNEKRQRQQVRHNATLVGANPIAETSLLCGLNLQYTHKRTGQLQHFLRNR